jgi:hypothetical protein
VRVRGDFFQRPLWQIGARSKKFCLSGDKCKCKKSIYCISKKAHYFTTVNDGSSWFCFSFK